MRYKTLFLSLFLPASFAAAGQTADSIGIVLENILRHAETSSLYREKVGWDTLRTRVYALAKHAGTVAELDKATAYLLEALGDEHGRVFYNNQMLAYYYGDLKPHQKAFDLSLYNKVQGGQTYPFEASMLDDQTGYVRLSGLPMGDNAQMSKSIEDAICRLHSKGIDRWIVDLRYNGGGNMFPMAEGLTQLIGEGKVGGAEGLTSEEKVDWEIRNGDFYYGDYSVRSEGACVINSRPKVAVLLSLYTASSGEAVAVMFKGRPNTRFFGEKTIGMTTVTDWKIINPSITMSLSVSYYRDRNGQVYRTYVEPDEAFPFVVDPLSDADACVQRAVEWLREGK